jgi:hypothetical protein
MELIRYSKGHLNVHIDCDIYSVQQLQLLGVMLPNTLLRSQRLTGILKEKREGRGLTRECPRPLNISYPTLTKQRKYDIIKIHRLRAHI